MTTNPSRTLRIAAEYYPILSYLAETREAVSLQDFRSLLGKHQPDDSRMVEQVIDLLVQLGLLESSPESDTAWEVPYAVGEFLRHLSMRQRLATPGQLAPIIAELQDLAENLRRAADARDLDMLRLYATRAKDIVDSARALSRENYRAILQEVMRIKARQDQRSLRERYLFITDLHDKHLKSLSGLVEVGGETDLRTAELLAVIRHVRERMPDDPFIPEWTVRISASVKRFREETLADFHSAVREVTPLFNQIRKDHALALAVSSLLDKVGRQGIRALDRVAEHLLISRWRMEGIFSTYAVEDYLSGVVEHQNAPEAPPLSVADADAPEVALLDTEQVFSHLKNAGVQDNLLDWLLKQYGSYQDHQILQVLHSISASDEFVAEPTDEPVESLTQEAIYRYHPLRIRAHGTAGQA